MDLNKQPVIAVLIPCFNEETTIAKVIGDFHKFLPQAKIFVGDNNSTDKTSKIATEMGAEVIFDSRKGKGRIMQTMFSSIWAKYYILVDGDDTYEIAKISELLQPVLDNKYDMVVGNRHFGKTYKMQNQRQFHNFGNHLVRNLINLIFQSKLEDIMSGYRVFSQKFIKNNPILSKGFEVETEITLNALENGFRILELPVGYKQRPEGSYSKLNTFRDGLKVLISILNIFKDYKPLLFYSIFSGLFLVFGSLFIIPPILEYFEYQFVFKVPSLIFGLVLNLMAVIFLAIGLILDTQKKYYRLLNAGRINQHLN